MTLGARDLQPYVDAADAEGAAIAGLRLIDREGALLNHPALLSYGFGFDARRGATPGARACVHAGRRIIRVARVADGLRWWDLQHELAHFIADVVGWRRPHDETAIDDLAGRLWIRRRAVLRAIGSVGWNPGLLAGYFGEVPGRVVFRRVAVEAHGIAIGRDGSGRRFAFGPEGRLMPKVPTGWEREHLRVARAGHAEPFLPGTATAGEVGPYEDAATGRSGTVILFPEEPSFLR